LNFKQSIAPISSRLNYKNWPTRTVVFWGTIFVFLLMFRAIFTVPMEFDGDSMGKWFAATEIVGNHNWDILRDSHHELRWSIIIPQVIVEKILPGRYENYFILPILCYSLFTLICIKSTYKLTGGMSGWCILAGLAISYDPISHVMGSQMKTVAFGLFYLSFSILFINGYVKEHRIHQIMLCALFAFLAYGAHSTYLVFVAVPMLLLVFQYRDLRGVVLFLLCLLCLFLIETILLKMFSSGEIQAGRVNYILSSGAHSPVTTPYASGSPLTVGDLFSRWKLIPKYNFSVMVFFVIGCLILFNKKVRRAVPDELWLYIYAALIYGLAVSFPIVSIDPLKLVIGLHARYLAPFFPIAIVVVVWFLFFITGGKYKQVFHGAAVALCIVLSGLFFVGSFKLRCTEEVRVFLPTDSLREKAGLTYCHFFRYSQNQNIYPNPNMFLFRAQSYYERFNSDYLLGEIGLFGDTRIGLFRYILQYQHPNTPFLETEEGWYTIDGESKNKCVMELGQTMMPAENYRACAGQNMSRSIFD
jgi:hypothetical protein